ncbi:MAG: lipocalin family protein [Xanthomonadales bacterium]|nr:lipocalin family protein [Xanthomonadales bacterium]
MNRPAPPTVDALELPRYLGIWYEIARLPMRHEPADYTDVSATYSLDGDGAIRVQNRAFDGEGTLQESIGVAKPANPGDPSRLEVSFLPEGLRWIPFTRGDYWILRLDPDYRTALVGSPDYEHLWLLHREPVMDTATRDDYLATARELGYRLDALIETRHTGRRTA